jgi:hypothetical protein
MIPQELPELPCPAHPTHAIGPLYSADQMHQYARDYASALAGAGAVAPVAWMLVSGATGQTLPYPTEEPCRRDAKLIGGQCRPLIYGDTHPAPVAVGVDEVRTVDDAMVRRFVDAVNPMLHSLPPPSVIRAALSAALEAKPHA